MRSVYDLDFKGFNKCGWDWNRKFKNCARELTETGLRVHPSGKFHKKLEFEFAKEVLFPIREVKTMEIKLYARSAPYFPLLFKIVGRNKDEEVSFTQATSFQKEDTVKSIRIDSVPTDTKYIDVSIGGECDSESSAEFLLQRVEIWLNGRNYTDEPILKAELSQNTLLSDFIQPLHPFNSNAWNMYGKKDRTIKVIGLGENAHGSKTISETRWVFLKDLIVNHNCTLILTELPVDSALLLDLFVQGASDDTLLVEGYLKLTYDHTSFLSFLIWLKKYNNQLDRKVHVVGIDNPKLRRYALMDFYTEVMDSTEVEPYLAKTIKGEFDELLNDTQQNVVLKSKLGDEYFQHLSSVLKEFRRKLTYVLEERDSLMFVRYLHAQKTFTSGREKIAILAHSAHLQRIERSFGGKPILPLGNFLAKKFKKRYMAINFNFGSGTYVQDSCSIDFRRVRDSLSYVPDNSFEAAAMKTGIDQFIYPTKYLSDDTETTAMIPRIGQNKNFFKYASLKNRFDYIVFSKRSEAFDNIVKNSFEYSNSFWNSKDQKFKAIRTKYLNFGTMRIIH